MFKTVQELVDQVLIELGLVTGSAVQVYTEPQILAGIETAFDVLFKKRFWRHLTKTTLHDLDGIVGVVTDTNINIQDANDIEWVRYEPFGESCVINNLHGEVYYNRQDYCYDTLTWDDTTYGTKLLQFYPKDLGLKVAIRARRRPANLTSASTIVPLDYIMMKHFIASNILALDGTNPSGEQRQTLLFDARYTDLVSNDANGILTFSKQRPNTFTVA